MSYLTHLHYTHSNTINLTNTVTNKSSQSHLGRARRYPHVGECTLPLRVLAVACTVHNKALRDIMGALRGITERYRVLWDVVKCWLWLFWLCRFGKTF